MIRTALYPGSFDPLTLGHEAIIERSLLLMDKLVIAIGRNSAKRSMLSEEQRKAMIDLRYKDEPRVKCVIYDNLTVDLCKAEQARFIIRGLRNINDFQYEQDIANINRHLAPEIETLFLCCRPEQSHISSTLVKEMLYYHRDIRDLVSPIIAHELS